MGDYESAPAATGALSILTPIQSDTPTRLDLMRKLAAEIAHCVRVRARGKKPLGGKGWGRVPASPDSFQAGDNIGIKVGESSGLVDIDLDCSEAVAVARWFLPSTLRHGRASARASHYWYVVPGVSPHEQLKDPTRKARDKQMIVELRGGKASDQRQTVAPPSIHETGESIEWEAGPTTPTAIKLDELRRAVRRLAAAALLARHWQTPRAESSMALTGALVRAGWPDEDAAHFVAAVSSVANKDDGEIDKRRGHVARARERLDAGEPATGLPRLVELGVPSKVIDRVRDWLDITRAEVSLAQTDDESHAEPESSGAVAMATRFVRDHATTPDGVTLRRWRGDWYQWARGKYDQVPDELIERDLYRGLKLDNRRDVGDVRHALIAVDDVLISEVELGTWIGAPALDADPLDVIACPNGLTDLRTGARAPATPRYFATGVLGVDHDPYAPAPTRWLAFLRQLWPSDDESIATLQEWIGYLLTPDTRQQKILLLVGARRSGKGTIMRIVEALLGKSSVVAPTLAGLATNFGLWPMIGKTAAIMGDVRLSGRTDVAQVVERLLSISGQDPQTVDRKHREPWTGYLSTRITIVSNELPKLSDSSGALAGRLVVLELRESWYGREDTGLTDVLRGELPGILLWAIEGWRRLRDRGHLVQPRASAAIVSDIEDLGSTVTAWVRDRCEIGPGYVIPKSTAYESHRGWCLLQGHTPPAASMFGRDLNAAGYPSTKPRVEGAQVPHYAGLQLRPG